MDWIWVLLVAVRGLSPEPADRWATTLSELDRVRAEAFETADPALLDAVYVPGSAARRSDAGSIEAYGRRGGRVHGAELRVLTCRVVRSTSERAELEVVDQLGRAQVVWDDGSTTDLPHDQPSRRLVTLEHTAGGWRIERTRSAG